MKRKPEIAEAPPTPVVAFYTHKGGVGKTTAVLNTAVCAMERGKRVVVVDCDAQMNSTAFLAEWRGGNYGFDFVSLYRGMSRRFAVSLVPSFQHTEEDKRVVREYKLAARNIYDLLLNFDMRFGWRDGLIKLPHLGYEIGPRLTLIAAHPMLSKYDELMGQMDMNQKGQDLYWGSRLDTLCRHLLEDRKFDLVLLDLSPSNSLFNQMAMATCSYFVMPMTGDKFSFLALETLDLFLSEVRVNFSLRLRKWSDPARLPKLLAVLYGRYEPGEVMLRLNGREYGVTQQHAEYVESISVALHREQLAPYLLPEAGDTMIPLRDASSFFHRLGHLSLTVFTRRRLRRVGNLAAPARPWCWPSCAPSTLCSVIAWRAWCRRGERLPLFSSK